MEVGDYLSALQQTQAEKDTLLASKDVQIEDLSKELDNARRELESFRVYLASKDDASSSPVKTSPITDSNAQESEELVIGELQAVRETQGQRINVLEEELRELCNAKAELEQTEAKIAELNMHIVLLEDEKEAQRVEMVAEVESIRRAFEEIEREKGEITAEKDREIGELLERLQTNQTENAKAPTSPVKKLLVDSSQQTDPMSSRRGRASMHQRYCIFILPIYSSNTYLARPNLRKS